MADREPVNDVAAGYGAVLDAAAGTPVDDVAARVVAEDAARNQRMLLKMYGVVIDGDRYRACGKPDCGRVVLGGSGHCCGPCADAAKHVHEIDAHTEGCDERWREREPLVAAALANGSW
ncbi:hypothetical protein ACGFJC_47620 [Nonomuraea fuscirosea]|uniref:hypothetical protein n=1 Tax=Nonomuraea fuscirosea TaxID=1291556 RepID=UPI00371FEDDA